ncbi:hypothetical protein SERLA73DRAFT_181759 [Serpula lacrymans var. lacrymans S7.3]|uniref:DUF572-domain-containing protein n=2 Tax=Serpula lacrymans var. lacrymans TaxID=341189 RepID=F8PYM4_SERL3|nr:uncharacterized protein SERLADRAFT_468101 [Serpula lacrymans var. lacrymans S7.9]EGN98987.1 hypothetical protein SERLA73DRAFT_181759 [Serpula lacrymans var. lacrymans S7.3]EGO24573.1 hypothetical protein SERLADRAFT_468101 [Serpula lacrymans var. lacrymans S7.9]
MQGFNKYYPPDYDGEKHKSLNSYRGKHALGDRARKLDQGILITRFEMPFNIWCGTCNNHIGMGVRYNAEKKKVGSYYSTPIFSFRCKCHLCDGWFEIQTDPKNTRYVVVSGARQKDEDWNPEENGGFPVHDSSASAIVADPLATLEKTTDAQNYVAKVQIPRLETLQTASDHYNSDPYSLSTKARKRFREEKKIEIRKKAADDQIKGRYALPETFKLLEDDDEAREQAKEEWTKRRLELETEMQRNTKKQKLIPPISSITNSTSPRTSSAFTSNDKLRSLKARILENTSRKASSFTGNKRKPPDWIPDSRSKNVKGS